MLTDLRMTDEARFRYRLDGGEKPVSSRHCFTYDDLFRCGVHLGRRKPEVNPRMKPYIHGDRGGQHIFDLERTSVLLKRALAAIEEFSAWDGNILFVGAREAAKPLVVQAALACEQFPFVARWLPGTLTNFHTLIGSVRYFPNLIVFLSAGSSGVAIREAYKVGVPTVAICDSNADPRMVTYPVPGNDRSVLALELYTSLFAHAALEGNARTRKPAIVDANKST